MGHAYKVIYGVIHINTYKVFWLAFIKFISFCFQKCTKDGYLMKQTYSFQVSGISVNRHHSCINQSK